MKKIIAKVLAAVAMMATGIASVGCYWILAEEPEFDSIFND